MVCCGKKSIMLIGASGYGGQYIDALYNPKILDKAKLVCVVDPYINSSVHKERLTGDGVKIFNTMEDAYDMFPNIDLVCSCSPIQHHVGNIKTALNHGSHILCEKPATATYSDLSEVDALAQRLNKCLAIGFQWSFAPSMIALKSDILARTFGRAISLKTLELWPRNFAYYKRGCGWAGKRIDENSGLIVNDSVASNATAHYLHNMYFLLGTQMNASCEIKSIDAKVFRANPIENYDTACVKVKTTDNVDILYMATHAVEVNKGPVFEYIFEKAVIKYDILTDNMVAYFNDGTIKEYGNIDTDVVIKLENVIDGIVKNDFNTSVFCNAKTVIPHTYTIDYIYNNCQIMEFSEEDICHYGSSADNSQGIYVRKLAQKAEIAYNSSTMINF